MVVRRAPRTECLMSGVGTIPTGLQPSAQGWPRQRTTLDQQPIIFFNPNGVASSRQQLTQPLQGCRRSLLKPRVARASQPWAECFESLQDSPRCLGLRWQSAAATPLSDAARRDNFKKPSTANHANHAKNFPRSRISCISRLETRTQSGVALRFPPQSKTPTLFHDCPAIANSRTSAETQRTQSFAKKIFSTFLRVLCASAFILIR